MPKIILQASTFQKNYDITTVSISPEEYKKSKTVSMDIIPHDGFSVNAKNFYSGYLSKKARNCPSIWFIFFHSLPVREYATTLSLSS